MISSERKEIAAFFLNIFKLQMNLSGRAGQYRLIADAAGDQIFELRVQAKGQWMSRRMSISALGDESGSKSKCFRVIYDDMIVVKIPPVPITDFTKYFESIQAECGIAGRLEPDIRCVTPSLSAILRKIPPFSGEPDVDSAAFEERCYQKISILPVFQNYLKIGNTFAFFMNLSRYSFLGQIIANMHDITEAVAHEIAGQAEIIGNPMMSEEIYGIDAAGVFFAIDGIYGAYEEALKRLQRKHQIGAIAGYSKKEWFLAHLAGHHAKPNHEHFTPDFSEDVNRLIENVLAAEPAVIETFRSVIRRHVYRKFFLQNKARMGGVLTNLLEHLAILKHKEIAMRDLKPDNVFIAGDLSGDPFLLETPENYSIGLIDFETSVTFTRSGENAVSQPLLAGTPSYSTVSHLFTNEILSICYANLTRILHLQDWYAVNGMIFNIITGQHLSHETGRLMPKMIRDIKLCARKKISMIDLYRKFSLVFWKTASQEFWRKIGLSRKMLGEVKVMIPKNAKTMLSAETESAASAIKRQIRRLIRNPPVSISAKDLNGLSTAASGALLQWRTRMETGSMAPHLPETARYQMIGMLEKLAALRKELECMEQFAELLTLPRPIVSADTLLEIMFRTVFYGMHLPEWGDVVTTPTQDPRILPGKTSG